MGRVMIYSLCMLCAVCAKHYNPLLLCCVPVKIVVVLTLLTRIIKSVVTGQAPVTLELRNTPGKKHKPKDGTRIV